MSTHELTQISTQPPLTSHTHRYLSSVFVWLGLVMVWGFLGVVAPKLWHLAWWQSGALAAVGLAVSAGVWVVLLRALNPINQARGGLEVLLDQSTCRQVLERELRADALQLGRDVFRVNIVSPKSATNTIANLGGRVLTEVVEVTLKPAASGTRIDVVSESAFKSVLFDWGRNAANVERISERLRQALVQASSAEAVDRSKVRARRLAAEGRLHQLQAASESALLRETLDSVRQFIECEPQHAATLLDALTVFLRSASRAQARDASTMGEELRLALSYLEVISLRERGQLTISFQVPEALEHWPCASRLLVPVLEVLVPTRAARGQGRVHLGMTLNEGDVLLELTTHGVPLRVREVTEALRPIVARLEAWHGMGVDVHLAGEHDTLCLALALPRRAA